MWKELILTYTVHKNHFQPIIDLNFKSESVMLLEINIREYLHDLGFGKGFLNRASNTLNIKKE